MDIFQIKFDALVIFLRISTCKSDKQLSYSVETVSEEPNSLTSFKDSFWAMINPLAKSYPKIILS